jgi:peptidoglycan/LPS O-acetylase OafA/YrhL
MLKILWWFIRGSLKEIGKILLLLVISHCTIVINVFLALGISKMQLLDIFKRDDIINMILTAGISMLAGILVLELSKSKVRKWMTIYIIGNCAIGLIISLILTIQIEKKEIFFDFSLIYGTTIIFLIISLLLVFLTNYSWTNVKEYINIQKTANESRNKSNFNLDNTEYKL